MAKVYAFKSKGGKEMDIFKIAEAFLTFQSMTHKKLQKLCYYAYAWYLALLDDRLCNAEFEAWVHGPVEPELYQAYKEYGWKDIPKVESVDMPDSAYDFIRSVFDSYGHLSGDELETLTHNEEPWKAARVGLEDWQPSHNIIDDGTLMSYYREVYERSQND